ncbi:S49 family peptidase [Roseinatronobacter bogoriensis]|uniref:S49 family peptidase n=1 Tax=Roseinatronobacter bogoriensis subsp. barguzinensis TaxID=441209 RepID=A0A2K8KBV8_9RHOB|nr:MULTISPECIES: S49 family peptidase [Rhodobaca]ATX65403.1 S49 family peptidase [Rhodobaca barguzinensis]TDW37586.1 serine protease SohB [Rhodobaca barguzinensis]TDY68196.1 serine protease SohB [Rhodobaca bogoriensis DSM 18756]
MNKIMSLIKRKPSVAVIRLQGMIASGSNPGRLNDASLAPLIEMAFRRGKPKAVALVINSPGGSPVQSALIAARIRRLAAEVEIPVHAFVEDVAASGGYWLATAADDIFVDGNSIVGSIGVISAGFGLHEALNRYGVERRVYTSGKSKSQLDPFSPENPDDVARLRSLQDQVHQNFIAQVKSRRGAKLADDDSLFTGEFWVGNRAVELGLVDGLGHLVPIMKERYGDKVRFRIYGMRRPFLSRLGLSLLSDTMALAEERALYARYGV